MEDEVLNLIVKCVEDRKERGQFPYHLTRVELNKQIDQALNVLYKQGKIKVGETVNDKYIELL